MQGVPLGLARRAIDEAVGIARTRVLLPQHVHMRDVPRVREAVAEAEMLLRSTRSYVYDSIDAAWARWEAGEDATPRERADLALARVQAFRTAKQIALAMVQLAGTQAIYSTSILDRLVRDAITINQHIVVSPVFVESVGALLLDVAPDGLMSILV
jgi:alkylation response protein AidB-like acyl-CoA dehydrogenase